MNMKTPKTRLAGWLSVAAAVGLAASPAAFAKITAHEDFGSYAPGESIVEQTGGGFGFTGDWILRDSNAFWGQPITRPEPVDFDGKILTTGAAFMGGAGRVEREFANGGYTSGTIWITHVFEPVVLPDSGENQFWVCSKRTGDFTYNEETMQWDPVDGSTETFSKFGVVAGVRVLGGELMVYDTSLDTLTSATEEGEDNPFTVGGRGEVYRKFTSGDPAAPVVITGPIFAAIKLNIASNTVSYYIFKAGDDTSSEANATWKLENLSIAADRRDGGVSAARGIAIFTVGNERAARGNIRVADRLREAAPTFNCMVDGFMSREALPVDDTAWAANFPAYPVNKRRTSDGHIAPLNAADFTANTYVAWNGLQLNVAVVVQDSDIRQGATDPDAVEIYLDGNMSRGAAIGWPRNYDEVDDYQLVFTLDGTEAGVNLSSPTDGNGPENPPGYKGPKDGTNTYAGIEYKRTNIAGGYVITAVLDMGELFGYEAVDFGQLVGFDVTVIDIDTEASATAKSSHSVCNAANINWNGTEGYATLYLQPAINPIAWDDFSGYTVDGNLKDQGTSSNGWAAGWHNTWSPPWANPLALAIRAEPITFAGDLGVTGQSVRGANSFARISRQLETAIGGGSVWIGFTTNPGSHLQVRLDTKGNGTADGNNATNSDATSVAGITISGGEFQYLDTSKAVTYRDTLTDEVRAEVYLPFSGFPFPNGNAFVAINIDYDAAKTNYYVFAPGDDVSSPANATYAVSLDLNAGRPQSFDSISLFTVFSNVGISNLRIGDDYSQLAPVNPVNIVMPAIANMTPDAIVLDGIKEAYWDAAPAYPIALIHGGKTIPDTDLSGTWRALWDEENLYIYAEVTDDQLIKFGETIHPENADNTGFQNDEFEIFTDANYDRDAGTGWPPVYDSNDIQWVFRPGSDGFFSGFPQDWQYGSTTNPDKIKPEGWGVGYAVGGQVNGNNYSIEIKLPFVALARSAEIVAGLSMMGIEIQLNDRDLPQEPAVNNKFVYPSDGKKGWADGANNSWHQTSTHGTLYFLPEAVAAYEFAADPAKLSKAGGDTTVTVTARYQYSDWTPTVPDTQSSWITLGDGAAGTGDGSFTMTLAPSVNPYTRTTDVKVGPNSVKVTQQGLLAERFEKVIRGLSATPDENGYYTHPWLGKVTIANFPWMHVENVGWQWMPSQARDSSSWIYDIELGWIWSANGIAPYWYSADLTTWVFFFGTYDSTGGGDLKRAFYNFLTSQIISVDLSMP